MPYLTAVDTPAPQYMVVVVHDEYEQSVRLFITEQAAREAYAANKCNEAYLSKIL